MILSLTIAEVSSPTSPFILQGQPYVESVKKAAAFGYGAVEIQLPKPEDLNCEEFFACCRQNKVRLVSITTGLATKEGLSLSSNDEDVRARSVERIHRMIDLAASCDDRPDVMIGLLTGSENACPNRESFLHNLGRSFKAISDYAEQKDINVNLEPVNHLDCKGLNTWDETVWLLDKYECSRIRLGADLYHMHLEEKNMLDTIRSYSHRIGCVQLMDRNRQVPGNGDFDFDPIIETLRSTGFDGPITMECLPLPDPETALEKAAQFYHKYF